MGAFDDIPMEGANAGPQPSKKKSLLSSDGLIDWLTDNPTVQSIAAQGPDNLRANFISRTVQGAADPMIGLTQLGANLTGFGKEANAKVAELERDYQAQRRAVQPETMSSLVTGKKEAPGFDAFRALGNVLSPVNTIPAGRLAEATTVGAMARQGAGVGAAAALAAPVNDADKGGFFGKKALQTIEGAATGAVLSPIVGKAATLAMEKLGIGAAPNVRASTHDIDLAVNDAIRESGQSLDDLSAGQIQSLRDQVKAAMSNGGKLDAGAAMRKADFESLGIEPTLGQITRDPMQFAREHTLSGLDGVGAELSARMNLQPQQLRQALPPGGGQYANRAGDQIVGSLKNIDDVINSHVSKLYAEARGSAGADLELPTDALVNAYNLALKTYGQDKMPTPVRDWFARRLMPAEPLPGTAQPGIFNTLEQVAANQPGPRILQTLEKVAADTPGPSGYGRALSPAEQGAAVNLQRPGPKFTFQDADELRKLVNENVGNDTTANKALWAVRNAVNDAQMRADASGGPFAPAVKAAFERYKLHEAIPAIREAAMGKANPDAFIREYILSGKTKEVKGLADVLQKADPASFDEVRKQLADELRRSGFGAASGALKDTGFSTSRYMETVRRIGVDKLSAFFSPREVEDILTVGRVGSYMNVQPAAARVGRSNTSIAGYNIPGVRQALAVIDAVGRPIQRRNELRAALSADVPVSPQELTPDQRNILAQILAASAGGSALTAAR